VRIAGRPTIAYSSTSPVNNSGNARSGKSAQQISADNVVQREPNFVNEWKKLQETRLPQTDRATHYYYSLLQFITLSQLGEIQSTAAQL